MGFRFQKLQIIFAMFVILVLAGFGIATYEIVNIKSKLKSAKFGLEDFYQTDSALGRRTEKLIELQGRMIRGENVEEELCRLETEEGTDKDKVADAYNCLMRIYASKHGDIETYKAIEMGSYALDLNYTPEYMANLYHVIVPGAAIQKAILLDRKSEIAFLERLAENPDKSIAMRALSRLSMIYKLGKNSSADPGSTVPDMREALSARKKLMSFFQYHRKDKKINVAIIINDKYAVHAGVTVASALMNADPDTFYTFYFVEDPEDPISQESKKKLLELKNINENSDIIFKGFPRQYINEAFFSNYLKLSKVKFPYLIVYRLFLDQLFPELQRIIYLDSDILVRRDLNLLYNSISDSYSVAAANDISAIGNILWRRCKEKVIKNYVNSGVMLLNLEKIRSEKSAETILKALGEYKCPLELFDQDIVNYTYQDKVKILSSRWNMAVGAHLFQGGVRNSFAAFITHFIGGRPGVKSPKPWLYPNAEKIWEEKPEEMLPEFRDYWAYRSITPWGNMG